ncbi:hypothetical protein [Saccharothrix lopnurensis]|uniref:Uncharacterized protein n=1 Tax=Saccharothrix lopnurensis TaxID=1670621 RepID=A0ABW1PIT0_9PSEU
MAGVKTAGHDAAVTALRVPELPAIGSEAAVEVELRNGDNVPVRLGGEVRFQDGFTPIVGQGGRVGQGSDHHPLVPQVPQVQPGRSITLTITARAERALTAAEVRAATRWTFADPQWETALTNNVLVRSVSTAAASPVSTPPPTTTMTTTAVDVAALGTTTELASTGPTPGPLLVIDALFLLAGRSSRDRSPDDTHDAAADTATPNG